jgi:hypothetical protein
MIFIFNLKQNNMPNTIYNAGSFNFIFLMIFLKFEQSNLNCYKLDIYIYIYYIKKHKIIKIYIN